MMKRRKTMIISRRSKRKCTLKNNAKKGLYKDLDDSFDEDDENNKKTVYVRPRQQQLHRKLTPNHQPIFPKKKFDIVFPPSNNDDETEEDDGETQETCYSSNLVMLADVLLKYGY